MSYHRMFIQSPEGFAQVLFPSSRVSVVVPLARSEAARRRGLLGRATIPPHDGMLFAMPSGVPASMTMAEMYAPLDFFFIGEGFIKRAVRDVPGGRLEPVGGPPVPWVLEMGAGFAREYDIKAGDPVQVFLP